MDSSDRKPQFDLGEAIAVLDRTPRVMDTLLGGLPAGWTEATDGAESWSPRVVIGHLIHGEDTDWIPRARIILEHGETRAFLPFDRFTQLERFRDTGLAELLPLFARKRAGNLATLAAWKLGPVQLARSGTHPEFGRVTMEQLLATWVAHDLGHVAQVVRVMARRYTRDIGPWKAYLSIIGNT
jgi:hypothetical protein